MTVSQNRSADRTGESDHASEAEAGHASAKGDPAEAIWRGLAELDEKLHRQRNIRLLTPEARVLIHLKLNGAVPVTTAMQVAGTSYRGFYAVLERLKQAGIVATVKDPEDQRVRRLSLDPSIPISPVNR
ncbi:MAG: MarR family winged helix-turn-helix transcriptional regulator [Novosphingobium sp.]